MENVIGIQVQQNAKKTRTMHTRLMPRDDFLCDQVAPKPLPPQFMVSGYLKRIKEGVSIKILGNQSPCTILFESG